MVELIANIVNNNGTVVIQVIGINRNRVIAGNKRYISTFIKENNIKTDKVQLSIDGQLDSSKCKTKISLLKYYNYTKQLGLNSKAFYSFDTDELFGGYITKTVGKQLYKSMKHDIEVIRVKENRKKIGRSSKITRQTVKDNVEGLAVRAKQINSDSRYLYNVDKVVILGECSNTAENKVDKLDVIVGVSPKSGITRMDIKKYGETKEESMKRKTRTHDSMMCALKDTISYLKSNKRSVMIHLENMDRHIEYETEREVIYERS